MLTEPVLYRLFLARQCLLEGIAGANDPLPFSRMRAVLALDDAVELVVVTLLPLLGVRPKRDGSLSEYLIALVEKKPGLGLHSGPLERLRRLRDRVKHDGLTPSMEDAPRFAIEAESFVRSAIAEIAGMQLEREHHSCPHGQPRRGASPARDCHLCR
jgi:hypothetical protein